MDWKVWALTSTSVHLLILLVCFVLVYYDKWPSFHHRRIKSLNLGARIRIKKVVDEHVICISQQKLWHYQAGGGQACYLYLSLKHCGIFKQVVEESWEELLNSAKDLLDARLEDGGKCFSKLS